MITEADDAPDLATALRRYRMINQGDETTAVQNMYADAARRMGATEQQIKQARQPLW